MTYHKALQGYFLADDFVHIDYLHHVFAGNWGSLAANFWGNWMQTEGTTFYRPLISLTLALDYLFQGAPLIFHLTNLLYQTMASLLLFACGKEMVKLLEGDKSGQDSAEKWQQTILPLAAAILFSVHPLHAEVVNWIIARVDSVALTFSLGAIWLWCPHLRDETKRGRNIGALVMLALGLMSKEMAITVPPTLTWLALLALPGKLTTRIMTAFKKTGPLWLLLIFYLLYRTMVLGTIAGGYQGSVGEGLSGSLVKRWFLDGSQLRVLFPFNIEVFGAYHSLSSQLKICYALIAASFMTALALARGKTLKGPLFCLGWYVICLAPTYQVWNLTPNLQGSRFVYFATAPLVMGLAWLLFANVGKNRETLSKWLATGRVLILIWLTGLYMCIAAGDNSVWDHAMDETRAFRRAVCERCANLPPGEKIGILNIPHSYRGAHMLYNAATMGVLLSTLSDTKNGDSANNHVITFEPATFGDGDLIAVSRLKRLAAPVYMWNRDKFILDALDCKVKTGADNNMTEAGEAGADWTKIAKAKSGEILLGQDIDLVQDVETTSGPLILNPLSIDYIDVKITTNDKAASPQEASSVLILKATGSRGRNFEMSMPLKEAHGALRFQLSEHKQWLALETVDRLSLTLKGGSGKALSVKSGSLADKQPTLEPDQKNLIEDNDGICRIRGPRPTFNFNAENVPGAKKVLVEFSKPNSWFEHYTGTLRNYQPSKQAELSTILTKARGAKMPLTFSGLKGHGYFQMRIIALDESDKPIGYFSDPLNFQM